MNNSGYIFRTRINVSRIYVPLRAIYATRFHIYVRSKVGIENYDYSSFQCTIFRDQSITDGLPVECSEFDDAV